MQQDDEDNEKEQDEVCDEVQKHCVREEGDGGDITEQEEEREGDEKPEWDRGHDDKMREEMQAIKRLLAKKYGEGGIIAGEEDENSQKGRKRPPENSAADECLTPKDRPNKRRKDGGESEDGDTTNDSSKRTASPEKTPRSRIPSPTPTATPGSARVIVRQTSVVPGLQDTESAVWDAAKRDSVISSLSLEQQTKMVRTALSLGSEEGIDELRQFVCNLRMNGKRGSEGLGSNYNLIAPHSDLTFSLASNTLEPQNDCLAYFSALYRSLDVLESRETLLAITERVNLAAMAQFRERLAPNGVGRNLARDANLKLFHAIFPHHSMVQRPEEETDKSTVSQDWLRLRNRLNEGRAWLQVRDLFGGNGAFLALPPQSVPDSHVSRITAKHFGPLLGLLDVAWRALDDGARRTMDALVRFALTGQPLPEAALALERPDGEVGAAPAGLSPMLAGWSELDGTTRRSGDLATTRVSQQNVEGEMNTPEVARTTTAATRGQDVVADTESRMWKESMLVVDDGLLDDVDFEERLSQQI